MSVEGSERTPSCNLRFARSGGVTCNLKDLKASIARFEAQRVLAANDLGVEIDEVETMISAIWLEDVPAASLHLHAVYSRKTAAEGAK